jgi:imidazolonepropionase-like amidohydrolase
VNHYKLNMKKVAALLLILLLPQFLLAQTKPLVLMHVAVIDMVSPKPQTEMTVVIEGNRITAVKKSGKVKLPKDAQIVDATGKFLIPGLWDMHAHVLRAARIDLFLPLLIANGVTGIRDLGERREDFAMLGKWRAEVSGGTRIAPRIFAAGLIVDGANPANPPFSIAAANETEAREAVRYLKQNGADTIKVYDRLSRAAYFAIVDEAKKQNISFAGHVPDEMTSAEASDAGQKSFEHLGNILRSCSTLAPEAIEAKVKETVKPPSDPNDFTVFPRRIAARTAIELATYSAEKCRALFAKFVKNGTWQVPTLIVKQSLALIDTGMFDGDARLKYIPPEDLEFWKPEKNFLLRYRTAEYIEENKKRFQKETELVGALNRSGVKIMTGTDAPAPYVFPGFAVHDELALLVRAGLTPFEALRAATRNPAEFLGALKSYGTVEKGKVADLVLLEANPLADISNTKRINSVVADGRYFSRNEIEKMLAQVETDAKKK